MTTPRIIPGVRTRVRNEHKYDYKGKGVQAVEKPRAYQPRVSGPPLLFATDIRMTILVTLALAGGPMRQKNLWKHIGKSAKTALYPLVERGLVSMWRLNASKVYVALDPCHPAAEPLRLCCCVSPRPTLASPHRGTRWIIGTAVTHPFALDGCETFAIRSATRTGRCRCCSRIFGRNWSALMSAASFHTSRAGPPEVSFGCIAPLDSWRCGTSFTASAEAMRSDSIRRTRWYPTSARFSGLLTGRCRSGACVRSDRGTSR